MELSVSDRYKYRQLKKKMEAAYRVFKQEPSITNASRHSSTVQAFNTFCIETMAALAEDQGTEDNQEYILEHFDDYKTCKQCGAELLYLVDTDYFINSSLFVPDFPGWCYSCLKQHCIDTNCSRCQLVSESNRSNCPNKELQNIYLNKD